MAWRIVKQPNGLLARWSDIVDHFTHIGMTEQEALEVCRTEGGDDLAIEKVSRGMRDEREDFTPGTGLERWNACMATLQRVHGRKVYIRVMKDGHAAPSPAPADAPKQPENSHDGDSNGRDTGRGGAA